MENIIVELSKYIMILLIALYTLCGFIVVPVKSEKKRKIILKYQIIFLIIMHLIGNLVLYLNKNNINYLLFYAVQLIVFAGFLVLYPFVYHNLSKCILNNMILFLQIGLLMVSRLSFNTAVRQFAIIVMAMIAGLFIPIFIEKIKLLSKLGWIYAVIGIGLLLYVYKFGQVRYGARNWVKIGGVMLQPSEFVKIIFVFFVASCFSSAIRFKKTVVISIVAACYILILVKETDLGGALILFVTYVCMVYVATQKPFYLFAGFGSGAVASVAAYNMFAHVRVRVSSWRDPWVDIDGGGYQITQSLFAIGTGGWFGLGIGKGLPQNVPVAISDFIFSAISEELGGIFAICLILLYISCFILFIYASMKIRNLFYKLIALGLGIIFIFQTFLCIGGAIKFIPSTGVTLPLISAGGSSVLSMIIVFSIIQGLYILNQDEDDKIERKKRKAKNTKIQSESYYD